jgi:competence/damage-inducible protein CinA C-terminal domain
MNNVIVKSISIGDELLIGQVVNTNASWLGNQLSNNGYRLDSVITVGDSEEAILKSFKSCMDADIVLVTGGLGPTADDITKPTVCKFFNTELVFNEDAFDNIMDIFRHRGFVMTERNRSQAFLPKACTYIPNRYGTAPCMWIEKNNVVFVFMPGVPFEMKGIFYDELLPRFKARFESLPYEKRIVMTTGIGESNLADIINKWESELPSFLSLAYLPQYGMVRLRLDGRYPDRQILQNALDDEVRKLVTLIPSFVFSLDDVPIEKVIFELLKMHHKTLATAESCTGGNIAHLITLIPGSSMVYKGSVVSYATEIKSKVLGVAKDVIDSKGVVSKEVAEAMAEGVRRLMDTDFALSSTGVAGPDGGTDEIPVGTVWIALATPIGTVSKRYNLGKDRENTISRASVMAYDMLRQWISANLD